METGGDDADIGEANRPSRREFDETLLKEELASAEVVGAV